MSGRTHKSEETKRRLKESAVQLFNKNGFMGTTVSDITKAARYAKGTFYLHWETKYDIVLDLYRDFLDDFQWIITSSLTMISNDPFEEVDLLIDRATGILKEYDSSFKMIHMHEIIELLTQKKKELVEIDQVIAPLDAYIEHYIRKGIFRPVDPALYGKILFSIAHVLMESAILLQYPAGVDTMAGELKLLIRKILQKN